MRIFINGQWHKGCDACGEILNECICEKENKNDNENSKDKND